MSDHSAGEATPRPWHVGPYYKTDIESAHGRVGETRMQTLRGEADARLIVQAVNAHDALVEFARQMERQHQPSGERQRCLSCGLDGNCCGTYHAARAALSLSAGAGKDRS